MKVLAMLWAVLFLAVPTLADEPDASADGSLVVNGRLQPGRQITLRANHGGRVDKVLAKVGQRVQAGDLLIELDNHHLAIAAQRAKLELEKQQVQETAAATHVQSVETQLKATRDLVDRNVISQKEILSGQRDLQRAQLEHRAAKVEVELAKLALEAAGHDLETISVQAPFEGTVSRIDVQAAEQVGAGDRLVELIDASQQTATVYLGPSAVRRLRGRLGEAAVTVTASGTDAAVPGKLVSIAPVLDPVNQQAQAVVAIDADDTKDSQLLPGHQVIVRIVLGQAE